MRANRVFDLTVVRGSRAPVFLADPARLDRVEVTSVEDGELLLYWDLPARDAARLARRLRADLAGMQAEEFLALWEGADGSLP